MCITFVYQSLRRYTVLALDRSKLFCNLSLIPIFTNAYMFQDGVLTYTYSYAANPDTSISELTASCHKKHEYIWSMGGDLNGFQGTNLFYKMNREGDVLGHTWGLLHQCNWMRLIIRSMNVYGLGVGRINCFPDIKPFMKWTRWDKPGHATEGLPYQCSWMCLITHLYGWGVGIWAVSEILSLL